MLKAVTNLVNVSQITGVLPVVNGGTGVTTSTGTGNTVLSAAPTLSGNVTLSTGNLIVANGQGIDFSATPGTGTSELFADYEEGTWTPVVTSGTGALTSYTSSGTYTKVGCVVTVSAYIKITNNGTGATYLNVADLPYTVGAQGASGAVKESGLTGNTVAMSVTNGGTSYTMWTYNNGYPGGTNAKFNLSFSYTV